MPRRLLTLIVVPALLAAPAVTSAAPAHDAKRKARTVTVGVVDYRFVPARLRVRPRTKIVWKWSGSNSATHDVKLVKGPKGVRRFSSPAGTSGIRYRRTLRTKGRYRLVCTFHASVMRQTIVVR